MAISDEKLQSYADRRNLNPDMVKFLQNNENQKPLNSDDSSRRTSQNSVNHGSNGDENNSINGPVISSSNKEKGKVDDFTELATHSFDEDVLNSRKSGRSYELEKKIMTSTFSSPTNSLDSNNEEPVENTSESIIEVVTGNSEARISTSASDKLRDNNGTEILISSIGKSPSPSISTTKKSVKSLTLEDEFEPITLLSNSAKMSPVKTLPSPSETSSKSSIFIQPINQSSPLSSPAKSIVTSVATSMQDLSIRDCVTVFDALFQILNDAVLFNSAQSVYVKVNSIKRNYDEYNKITQLILQGNIDSQSKEYSLIGQTTLCLLESKSTTIVPK